MPTISSRHPYRLGRSRTGLGLFATRPIRKGTFIIKYWGPKISNKRADEIDNRYLFELNSRWTIDGSPRRNIARYINHSCRPNAETDIKRGEILISAMKNIEAGDEITYDYGKDHFNGFIKPIGCQCDKCREKRREERAAARAKAARSAARAAKRAKRNGKSAGARKAKRR
jgi:SET domain-containing protein